MQKIRSSRSSGGFRDAVEGGLLCRGVAGRAVSLDLQAANGSSAPGCQSGEKAGTVSE